MPADQKLLEAAQRILDQEVNPVLNRHNGHASATRAEKQKVYVRLGGACSTCPDARETFTSIVEQALKKGLPEDLEVLPDDSEEEEMLNIARRLLRTGSI